MPRTTIFYLTVLISFQFSSAAVSVRWTSSTAAACWVDKGVFATQPWSPQASYIEVLPDSQRQTIDGFGGCFNELEWTALNKLSAASRDSVMRSLYDTTTGCRFNMGRMPIGANDYALSYYSHDDSVNDFDMSAFSIARHQQYVVPFIKEAMKLRPDLRMWGSPWTPPAWMKTNNNYAGGAITWTPQNLQAYALYLEKCVIAYQAAGLNFFAVFVQNEPWSNSNYPTCLWTPANLRDFIKTYLGPKFKSDNVPAQIWYSTVNNATFSTAVGTALSDSTCRSYIAGVGYQWEGYSAMGTHHKLYPAIPFWQTETRCGNGINNWAWADTQFLDRKWAFDSGAQAFFEWNMVLEKGGRSTWGWAQSAMISLDTALKKVTYNPEYYVSKHFSFFIAPGARSIKSAGPFAGRVAFINPNGDIVVVVRNGNATSSSTAIKVDSLMYMATIPANSFNTFVISGARQPLTTKITTPPENTPPAINRSVTGKVAITGLSVYNLQGKKLFTIDGLQSGPSEADIRTFIKKTVNANALPKGIVIVKTFGKRSVSVDYEIKK
jgi:glucosylceramidase